MLARIMAMIILAYAALALAFSAALYTPFSVTMADYFRSEIGIQYSAVLSALLGVVFLLALPAVKFPMFFKVIGIISLIQAPFILLLPMSFWRDYIDFMLVDNLFLFQIIGAPIGIGMFAFVIYAALPERKSPTSTHES